MKPLNQFEDADFGTCRVLQYKQELKKNVCLFASHTILPFLPDYIYYYLNDVKQAGFSIIFISSSEINDSDLAKLSQITDLVIEKENRGTDFGAWCSVLRWLDFGKKFENLYLCNDSVFGPFIPFKEIHNHFLKQDEEVLGATDSHQGLGYHIQSYFVGLKDKVLSSKVWENFWKEMVFHEDKSKVIEFYEIGLTQFLIQAGFRCFIWADWSKKISYTQILNKVSHNKILRERWLNRVLVEKANIVFDVNPSSFVWEELITLCNSPFLKRELFLYNNLYEEFDVDSAWVQVLNTYTKYPVSLIKKFLSQIFFYKSWKKGSKYSHLSISVTAAFNNKLNTELTHPFPQLNILEALQEFYPLPEHKSLQPLLSNLCKNDISYLSLSISDQENNRFQSVLIYLDDTVTAFSSNQLHEIKATLKEIPYSLVIVPDDASRYIVSSILGLRAEALFVEQKLLNPKYYSILIEDLNYQYKIFLSGQFQLSLYKRPSLADIVKDALKNENRTGFIKQDIAEVPHSYGIQDTKDKLNNDFLIVQEKYENLYENTPRWYKKLGQIVKLFKGNKRLLIQIIDKGKKDYYKPTAEDLAHWYYLQYEVLPQWYKNFGKRLIKEKYKNG